MSDPLFILPPSYETYLRANGETEMDCGVLYALEDLVERNRSYEVQTYMPGYIAIGDDGGGQAILIESQPNTAVYLLGHGTLGSLPPVQIAANLMEWLSSGCPLPD